jgi:predicted transcriptional regulator
MMPIPLDRGELIAQLARRDMSQREMAEIIGARPSTFSSWIRGVNPAPDGLREAVEHALGLRRGALAVKEK